MLILAFLVFTLLNLGLIFAIVRHRGLFSAEGLCLSYVFLFVATDAIGLAWAALFDLEELPMGLEEFRLRLYPGLVHLVGLASLGVGLVIADRRPRSTQQRLSETERSLLRATGVLLGFLGLAMVAIGSRFVGPFSSADFYQVYDQYRSEAISAGGFWYRGADIAVFGLGLILASVQRGWRLRALLFAAMPATSFLLTTGKGGTEWTLVCACFLVGAFDRPLLRALFRPSMLLLAACTLFFATGVKVAVRKSSLSTADLSFSNVVEGSLGSIGARYSHDGLFRGYSKMVNYLSSEPQYAWGWEVAEYTLTSWVPRLLHPNKQDHPFRAIGHMINADEHVYEREVSAPTLVGSAFADQGLESVVLYLGLGGVVLGLVRRLTTSARAPLYARVGYLMFSLFGGVSSETGFLGIVYVLVMVSSIMGVSAFLLQFLGARSVPIPGRPVSSPRGS